MRSKTLINRELSWLEFNARVLEEARDPTVPLLERLKFLAIFSSNLDEFYMVRVARIRRGLRLGLARAGPDGLPPREVLRRVSDRVRSLIDEQYRLLVDEILPRLETHGVRLLRASDLDRRQRAELFDQVDAPLRGTISKLGLDPRRPVPSAGSRTLALLVALPTGAHRLVPLPPRALPRFVRVPGERNRAFVRVEDIVRMHVAERLGRGVLATPIRITRDAEFDVVPEVGSAGDLRAAIERGVRDRRLGACVRLEHEIDLPAESLGRVLEELELDEDHAHSGPIVGAADLFHLASAVDLPALRDRPHVPRPVAGLEGSDPFSAIRERDVLVHHPYESFDHVARFFEAAAADPDVVEIRTTLYRVSAHSPVARALAAAAAAGKDVLVLIELRARFSEAANIAWARALEAAGARVVHGIPGLKTHVKATLVVRREGGTLRRYCHLGTGNYHEQNAVVYEDYGLFTCRPAVGEDLDALFDLLTGRVASPSFRHLVVAPRDLRAFLVHRIRREAEHARAGRTARILAKVNAVSDPELVRELYTASVDGVRIDLVVRGICCLRPGVPGLSENVRAVSVVHRFLEHSRAWRFENGGRPELWLSSADWMSRSLERRIEAAFPVLDPDHRARIEHALERLLDDDATGRELLADGSSRRRGARAGVGVQEVLAGSIGDHGRQTAP